MANGTFNCEVIFSASKASIQKTVSALEQEVNKADLGSKAGKQLLQSLDKIKSKQAEMSLYEESASALGKGDISKYLSLLNSFNTQVNQLTTSFSKLNVSNGLKVDSNTLASLTQYEKEINKIQNKMRALHNGDPKEATIRSLDTKEQREHFSGGSKSPYKKNTLNTTLWDAKIAAVQRAGTYEQARQSSIAAAESSRKAIAAALEQQQALPSVSELQTQAFVGRESLDQFLKKGEAAWGIDINAIIEQRYAAIVEALKATDAMVENEQGALTGSMKNFHKKEELNGVWTKAGFSDETIAKIMASAKTRMDAIREAVVEQVTAEEKDTPIQNVKALINQYIPDSEKGNFLTKNGKLKNQRIETTSNFVGLRDRLVAMGLDNDSVESIITEGRQGESSIFDILEKRLLEMYNNPQAYRETQYHDAVSERNTRFDELSKTIAERTADAERQEREAAQYDTEVQASIEDLNTIQAAIDALEAKQKDLQTQLDALNDQKKVAEAGVDKPNGESIAKDNFASTLHTRQEVEGMYRQTAAREAAEKQQTEAEQEVAQFQSGLSNGLKQWMGVTQVVNIVRNGIREAYEDIKNLDQSMTNIAVVTDMSVDDLWGKIDEYMAVAQQYGVTTQGVYEVSQLFYQQGNC